MRDAFRQARLPPYCAVFRQKGNETPFLTHNVSAGAPHLVIGGDLVSCSGYLSTRGQVIIRVTEVTQSLGLLSRLVAHADLHAGPVHGLFAEFDRCDHGHGLIAAAGWGLSHDPITHWLSQRTYGPAEVWRQAKPLIRQAEAPRPAAESAVLIVDDSVLEKAHTYANKLIYTHWGHRQQRYGKGLNFVSLRYQAGELA